MYLGNVKSFGAIAGWENGQDDIFNENSSRNRDDCLEPFRMLRQSGEERGIELHTSDFYENNGKLPDFNLFIESIPIGLSPKSKKNYLILFETNLTVPINSNFNYLEKFDLVFTWSHELVKNYTVGLNSNIKCIDFRIPNTVPANFFNRNVDFGFQERPLFCCLIGSNRHSNIHDSRELYSERVRAIQWFERNAPDKFALYGNGWHVPQKRLGFWGKTFYRYQKMCHFLTRKKAFPSYVGPAKTKYSVLSHSRYSICFENAKNIEGYLTEKIFDCLFAGCVPIYLGEPNIEKWVDPRCFIDFRNFKNYDEMYEYLSNITENEYKKIQAYGRDFILSTDYYQYSSKNFAEIIMANIEQDLLKK
jgi:hypothetical protein